MNTPARYPDQDGWLYYYALYYKLAHWTASLTILAWLLTLGILLSIPQTGKLLHLYTSTVAIGILWLTEGYLSHRICKLGAYVRETLSPGIYKLEGKGYLCWSPFIAATLAVGWDMWLLFC